MISISLLKNIEQDINELNLLMGFNQDENKFRNLITQVTKNIGEHLVKLQELEIEDPLEKKYVWQNLTKLNETINQTTDILRNSITTISEESKRNFFNSIKKETDVIQLIKTKFDPRTTSKQTTFQYATEGELANLENISNSSKREIDEIAKFVEDGNWTELVKKWLPASTSDIERNVLFAAHYAGSITALELYTALTFIDSVAILKDGISWEICGSSPDTPAEVPPNQRYVLKLPNKEELFRDLLLYKEELRDSISYALGTANVTYPKVITEEEIIENEKYEKTSVYIIPTLGIANALLRLKPGCSGHQFWPVYNLSERKDMMNRLSEGKHDIAFFACASKATIHGRQPMGFLPFAHDVFHANERTNESNYFNWIRLATHMQSYLNDKLPNYSRTLELNINGDPILPEDAPQVDAERWIFEHVIGDIIDGHISSLRRARTKYKDVPNTQEIHKFFNERLSFLHSENITDEVITHAIQQFLDYLNKTGFKMR